MKIIIENPKENLNSLSRKLGYIPKGVKDQEFEMSRPLGSGRYPRFHIYAREKKDEIVLNLHLDQKRTSYQGSKAHSGEGLGELVEKEAERIKKIIGAD